MTKPKANIYIYMTQNKINLFVLSGHGSESFAAFLNGVILQKTTRQLSLQQSPRHKSRVVTAAVITAALFFVISLHLRMRQRTHFHAPTIQTNSFCFGSNITVFPCPMSINKFIFILSRNPFYQQHLKMRNFDFK